MGFFATFWTWLNGQLATYIGDNTARLAAVLEPAVVTLATIYVMAWGYLHLTGKIDEPVIAGLKRIGMMALILGVGLQLWLYNTVIVDTFYNAPAQLAAAMVGSSDPVSTIDTIWESGGAVGGCLVEQGCRTMERERLRLLHRGRHRLVFDGRAVRLCHVPDRLSSIALAVLLALGPLFMALLFFDATRRLFVAWIAQLANYGLITVLTVMVAALLLRVVQSYAAQTAARGTAILTVDALNMVLVAVLVFLVLRQVMPIAAGLAGGVSLNSFGLVSRSIGWGLRIAPADAASEAGARNAWRVVSGSSCGGMPHWRRSRCRRGFQPKPAVDGSANAGARADAGAGDAALGQNWRHPRR